MKTILISGATGFIGSHITRELLRRDFKVYATCRKSSDFKLSGDFFEDVEWVDLQSERWYERLSGKKIDILIHSAWSGITYSDRDNWEIQLQNFELSKRLFGGAIHLEAEKIISFGSQAEYGTYDRLVSEDWVPTPIDAYGAVKLLTMHYLQILAKQRNTDWYWLRVFSIFGPGERETSLVPYVLRTVCSGNRVRLTEGNQEYDYVYIDDFVHNFMKVVTKTGADSGVYNICSGRSWTIKRFILELTSNIQGSDALLDFGAIPHRAEQRMFVAGDNRKFTSVFGNFESQDRNISAANVISYYEKAQ